MELKRALELRQEYNGIAGVIKCDGDYICLNDLLSYFPGRRMDVWLKTNQTTELIAEVEKMLIPPRSGIITKRGKGGGTFAHHLIAMDFAAWLSVEFKLKIYMAYISGTQTKKDWNIIRELAAFNYKMLSVSVLNAHKEPKPYHFSNEALMINEIVLGTRTKTNRDELTDSQLKMITDLEAKNAAYIDLGMSYQERKERLFNIFTLRTETMDKKKLPFQSITHSGC